MIRAILRILLDIPQARLERRAVEQLIREQYAADVAALRQALLEHSDFRTDGTRS